MIMSQKSMLTNINSMQSEGGANHFVSIGINFGFTLLCVVPTWIILSELEGSHEVRVTAEDVQEDAKLGDKA
jgi:hypothetical protein